MFSSVRVFHSLKEGPRQRFFFKFYSTFLPILQFAFMKQLGVIGFVSETKNLKGRLVPLGFCPRLWANPATGEKMSWMSHPSSCWRRPNEQLLFVALGTVPPSPESTLGWLWRFWRALRQWQSGPIDWVIFPVVTFPSEHRRLSLWPLHSALVWQLSQHGGGTRSRGGKRSRSLS